VDVHANLGLGRSVANEYKLIAEDPADARHPLGIKVEAPIDEEARSRLADALTRTPERAAESLGHVRYRRRVEAFGRWLAERADPEAGAEEVGVGIATLSGRQVRGRRVKEEVLQEMRQMRDSLLPKNRKGGQRTK